MKSPTLSTRQVIRLGFALPALLCLAIGLGGWLAAGTLRSLGEQQLGLARLQSHLNGTLRAADDVLVTSDSSSARKAFGLALTELRSDLARQAPALAGTPLAQPLPALARAIEAFGQLPKPGPDNDDAMIAYGKLSAQADATLAALAEYLAQQDAQAQARASGLLGASGLGALGGGVLALLAGLAVVRRVEHRLGGELETAQALMRRVGQGDLRAFSHQGRPDSVIGTLAAMTDGLRGSMATVREAARTIHQASAEVAAGSQDLAQRTDHAAGSLQRTASSLTQLTATVGATAGAAGQAEQLARGAVQVAGRGGAVVADVVSTMGGINGASRRIGDIVGTIDGIAFRTNILALNAAVEAARAGESGRGFAVVASEVRSLAQRSAEAAREIRGLIGASVEQVDAGTRLVQGAGATMGEIVGGVERVSGMIAEITRAAGEQTQGISQIDDAVRRLDEMTQQNATLVEQSAAAAHSLAQQAQGLTALIGQFQIDAAAPA